MASAKKTTVDVVKTVTVKENRYTLELSEDEAQAMRDVFYVVGGDIYRSRRKHIDAISSSLYSAGITFSDKQDTEGTVYFK